MKYKLINEDIKEKNLLDIIYENRGITREQVDELLNANDEYKNPFEIFNMDKAKNLFKHIYNKDLIIGLLIDTDVDGFTSSTLLYQLLIKKIQHPKENIKIFKHSRCKAHGLSEDVFYDMLKSDVNLWLIADSSTNDKEQQKKLSNKGMNVIILDHHECEDYEEIDNVIIVNNQLGDLSNKHLSGVGVVYKFIEALGYSVEEYKDLVAIGQVADAMSCIDLQNRAFINEGLQNINNELIKEFFKDYKNPIIENISWGCANYMNSVIRYGTMDEKDLLWKAMNNEDGTVTYKNKKGEIIEQTLQEGLVRISNNVKSRQNNSIKKSVKTIERYIYKHELEKDKCIIIENVDMVEPGLGGITAQKLSSLFKRPVIILSPFKDEMSGSLRSQVDLKDVIFESGLVTFANGHSRACGVGLPKDNIPKLKEYLNEYLKDMEVGEVLEEVDYVFNGNEIELDNVKEVANLNSLWCRDCQKPMFVVKTIDIESHKITYKKEGISYVASFTYNGITYKKRFCSREVYETMICKKDLKFGKSHLITLTLLCEFEKTDKDFYYVSIKDFNSVKSSKIIF